MSMNASFRALCGFLLFWILAVHAAYVSAWSPSDLSRSSSHRFEAHQPLLDSGSIGHDDDSTKTGDRRTFFADIGSTVVFAGAAAVTTCQPAVANAAAPITASEADSFSAKAQRLVRPKPPKVLRSKLNRDFAVLLMRSSYNALDQIDCVAMEQFQRDFFFVRQAEYEPYVQLLGPGMVQQGDLTDPYYFDFISFAQYATINREISQDPPAIFQEQQPLEAVVKEDEEGPPPMQLFQTVLVRRDPSLTKEMLGPTHDALVGKMILSQLEETFGNTKSSLAKVLPPTLMQPDTQTIESALSQLAKLFLLNGFAWDGQVSTVKLGSSATTASGAKFQVVFNAPATIWSSQALQTRRVGLQNDFYLKTAQQLLKKVGYDIVSSSTTYEGANEIITFTLQ